MKDFISDLGSYLYDVLIGGFQLVFTFFTALGVILFFNPSLAERLTADNLLARIVGAVICLISFLLANFLLYRRLKGKILRVSERSVLIYPYSNPPYNSVEIHYVGPERAKDLEVRKLYKDPQGQEVTAEVTEFFPQNDLKMRWHHLKVNVLEPDQILRFHLVKKKSTLDGKVTVWVRLTGVESGKKIEIRREFDLKEDSGVFVA